MKPAGIPDLEHLQQTYPSSVPHCGQMGQRLILVEQGRIQLHQPYGEHLLGDVDRQLIHTSVQLTMVDSGFGAAALSGMVELESIATIDLHMDYYRPAVAGQDLYLEARIERMTPRLVFVRGHVWQSNRDQPTAAGSAKFMRAANSQGPLKGRDESE